MIRKSHNIYDVDQLLSALPFNVRTLLTVAMLDIEDVEFSKMLRGMRASAELELSTESDDRHLGVLCKMIGMSLLESLIPRN